MIMISNSFSISLILCYSQFFFIKLLTLSISFSTAVRALVAAKIVILGFKNNGFNKESTKNDQKFKPKITIAIVGDSMLKISMGQVIQIFAKSISGAKTKCMKSYIIPTVELEPNVIVIHCAANDLRRQEQPEEIVYEIANLALSIKSKKNEVVVSGIIPRKDRFRDKAKETNESLLAICASRNIPFINHGNIDTRTHINCRGLHLTTRAFKIVGDNMVKFTKNLLFTK